MNEVPASALLSSSASSASLSASSPSLVAGPEPAPVQPTLPNPQRILAELKGKIEPVPVGFFYRIGLFLVAVVMVILPVV